MAENPASETPSSEDTKLTFNIRGSKFETLKTTLDNAPVNLLHTLDITSQFYDKSKQEYFFDRDPDIFNSILNMCNCGKLHVPKNVCVDLFRTEIKFWGVPNAMISECCWRTYFQLDDDMEVSEELQKTDHQIDEDASGLRKDSIRYKIWIGIEHPRSSTAAKVWYVFYMALVLLSTLLLYMWTMAEFRTGRYLTEMDLQDSISLNVSAGWTRFMLTDPILAVFVLDIICIFIFTVELIIHFLVHPGKIQFFKRAVNIITLVVVSIMWVGIILEFDKLELTINRSTRHFFYACKSLTMTRLFLFLRLENQFRALRVFMKSIRESIAELLLMLITFAIAAMIFGCFLFFIQIEVDDDTDSLLIWVWWAIITMTSVGYGDFYPTSTPGYVVGVVCALCGVVLIALPIAVISSNFSIFYALSKNKDRMRKSLKHEMQLEEKDR